MKYFLLFTLLLIPSWALIISPEEAMKANFHTQIVTQKSMILTKQEFQNVQKLSQTKLSTKLFRLYKAFKDQQTIGFGVLLIQKVRSKTTAVLYMISPDGDMKNIEVIAFNEPIEYLPTKPWMQQFSQKQTNRFEAGKNISTVSGATLSANAIIKSANIALAIWKEKVSQ